MTRPPDRRIHVIAALLALALLALGFPALDTSNVTWDAALGDLFFGQRYLSYFTSFDARYLDFAADPYPPGHQPDLTASPFRSRPWEYYPVANIVGAASSVLFSRWLGWLDPFDGFQAMNLGFGLLLVLVWFPFLARRLGLLAATTGILLLFTAPRLAGDLLSNPKDYPSMALFTVALAAFASAWERGSPAGWSAPGLSGGSRSRPRPTPSSCRSSSPGRSPGGRGRRGGAGEAAPSCSHSSAPGSPAPPSSSGAGRTSGPTRSGGSGRTSPTC